MANLSRIFGKVSHETHFTYDPEIGTKSEEELNKLGFYRGFPCPHGHIIRHIENHWCYFCVQKIIANACGFDINYLESNYKVKYHKLWKQIKIGDPKDCWEIKTNSIYSPGRIKMPSYRSQYSDDLSENVSIHKAIYQCAWGDVGKFRVTRICQNPKCANPLHLVSSWNRALPPKTINQMVLEFNAEKLMLYNNNKNNDQLSLQGMKINITNPLEHQNVSEE